MVISPFKINKINSPMLMNNYKGKHEMRRKFNNYNIQKHMRALSRKETTTKSVAIRHLVGF